MAGTAGLLAPPRAREGSGDRAGRWATLAVVALGFAIRLAWVLHQRHAPLGGDPYYYHYEADLVAHGKGFIEPFRALIAGQRVADAAHPPLFVLYLAAWTLAGGGSVFWHLFASAVLGTASVAVVAEVGRRLGGRRVGVLAGFLAAVAPNLWLWDGTLAAETMAIFTVSLFLLAVVRYLATPSRLGLVAVAACAALAGLSRAELILLAAAVVPLAWRTAGIGRRTRLAWVGTSLAVAALLVAPWAIYNQSRFDRPVPLSTGLGLVMASSDCNAGYYGSLLGYWSFGCSTGGTTAARGYDPISLASLHRTETDNSVIDARLRRVATRYVRDHPGRLPAVIGARLGRVVGLYRPVEQAHLQNSNEGAPLWITGSIMSTWYLFAALALVGGRALRRAGVPLLALLTPAFAVLLTTVLTYGIGRFRAPADTIVLVLAAVGIDALVRRRWEADTPPDPAGLVAAFARPRKPDSACTSAGHRREVHAASGLG